MTRIQDIKEAHQGEWLAIEVLKEGPAGPQEGRLIYHSDNKNAVWKAIKGDSRRIHVPCAGPLLEEDYAVAF